MRWVASLVAETHRILTRGGVFLYPRDTKDPAKRGRLRLLYEANPVAFIVEQAGGLASTGRERGSRAHRALLPRPQRGRVRHAAVQHAGPVPY
jgi:hypothetical protein